MAHKNLTASGSSTIRVDGAAKLFIQVNAALTGTIAVADNVGTVATITNPTVGSQYQYWDLQGTVTVNPSATCDITVSTAVGNTIR